MYKQPPDDQDEFEAEVLQDMQDHLRISIDLKRILTKCDAPHIRKFRERSDLIPKANKPVRKPKHH